MLVQQMMKFFGVQIIIPLDNFTLENGATCILPGSYQNRYYYKDIEENQEEYNELLTTKDFNLFQILAMH